jgi:hypothetical protein
MQNQNNPTLPRFARQALCRPSTPAPVHLRGYFCDLAHVTAETAATRDPRVLDLALRVLARQAPILHALAGGVR